MTALPVGYPYGHYEGIERRHKPRIREPFLTRVHGVDVDGRSFKINTLVDNVSASGLYIRLARPVNLGTRLFIVIHLSTSLTDQGMAGRVAILGVVLRSEPRGDGLCGLAIKFVRYRLI